MSLDQINSIIHVLQSVRDKPSLWIGTDFAAMKHFLDGFHLATGVLTDTPQWDGVYAQVLKEHGWRVSPDLIAGMAERGLDDAAIAGELLTIYIETWQSLRQSAAEQLRTKLN